MEVNIITYLLNFEFISLFFSLLLITVNGFLLARISGFKEWYLFSLGFIIAILCYLLNWLSPYYFYIKYGYEHNDNILRLYLFNIANIGFFIGLFISGISLSWHLINMKKKKLMRKNYE